MLILRYEYNIRMHDQINRGCVAVCTHTIFSNEYECVMLNSGIGRGYLVSVPCSHVNESVLHILTPVKLGPPPLTAFLTFISRQIYILK